MIDIRKILVVKLSSLGDIVHATPCLQALRDAWPNARITVAVEGRFAAVLRHRPAVDELVEFGGRLPLRHLYRSVKFRLASSGRYELAVDLQGNEYSAVVVYASGAKIKAGRGGRRPFWQSSVQPNPNQHAIRVCAEVLGAVGVDVSDLSPRVYVGQKARDAARIRLDSAGIRDGARFLLSIPLAECRRRPGRSSAMRRSSAASRPRVTSRS